MNLLPGSSEDALITLVNQVNPLLPQPLKAGELYFGKLKALTDGTGRVEIPAVTQYDSAYEGYVKFRYKRLNLSQAFGTSRPTLRDIGYPSLHQLLPVINKALGVNLNAADVIDTKIDWLGNNENINIQITATAESLGYEGGFVITFTRVRPMLTRVIGNKVMDVQKHPINPILNVQSLSMVTFSMDFTGEDAALQIWTATGLWWNYWGLNAMMAARGFPNWPQAKRGDVMGYATKDLPEANKDFTNVIVQKDVTLAGYKGDAYFHYNRS